ncbi:hypothetical protein C7B79_33880 [Chroococcidiopsis cubana CCALA 043]|nr:hypothetical protein C7B79_33880 [Chroococcidiopsis cubana CCALA 043]
MTVLVAVCCPHCQSSEVVRHGGSPKEDRMS